MTAPDPQPTPTVEELLAEIARLKDELRKAQENERRALADYLNLQRRTSEDRFKSARMASRDVLEAILQPFGHLLIASEQLKEKGLEMVVAEFQRVFAHHGLEEITVLGQEVDPAVAEVITKQPVDNHKQKNKIISVVQRGYRLNGEVIQIAKVIVGE